MHVQSSRGRKEKGGLPGAKWAGGDCWERQAGPEYAELCRPWQRLWILFLEQWETTQEVLVKNAQPGCKITSYILQQKGVYVRGVPQCGCLLPKCLSMGICLTWGFHVVSYIDR